MLQTGRCARCAQHRDLLNFPASGVPGNSSQVFLKRASSNGTIVAFRFHSGPIPIAKHPCSSCFIDFPCCNVCVVWHRDYYATSLLLYFLTKLEGHLVSQSSPWGSKVRSRQIADVSGRLSCSESVMRDSIVLEISLKVEAADDNGMAVGVPRTRADDPAAGAAACKCRGSVRDVRTRR